MSLLTVEQINEYKDGLNNVYFDISSKYSFKETF